MEKEEKEELLREAERRFPRGCSYKSVLSDGLISEQIEKDVNYTNAYWWNVETSIALANNKGLVYKDGYWAKVVTNLELCELY